MSLVFKFGKRNKYVSHTVNFSGLQLVVLAGYEGKIYTKNKEI